MDLRCTYEVGSKFSCAEDYGVLCVEQFQGNPPSLSLLGNPNRPCVVDAGQHAGTTNDFTVVRTRNVNGINVVFGKKTHRVSVNATTTVLTAYWKSKNDKNNMGGLLKTCDTNATALETPCAINDLSRENTPVRLSGVSYPNMPSLETVVPVCALEGDFVLCSDVNGTDILGNYYSPIPVFPGFVEVAVTPATRSPTDAGKAWFYNSSDGGKYVAPHPPMQFKSSDYDGQQMAQVIPTRSSYREVSNLQVKCFGGLRNGSSAQYSQPGSSWAWPSDGDRCNHYFDGDGGGGSMVKFDFDFGSNPWAPLPLPVERNWINPNSQNGTLDSILFGTDQYRCTGRGLTSCNPLTDVCSAPGGGKACSGSGMFTQHVVQTIDLPFLDVDNMDEAVPHITDRSDWYTDATGSPKGADVQTVFSAYPCFAGSANQPPQFVKSLDSAILTVDPRCRRVDLPGDYTKLNTEVRCKVGELCVFPVYAQDFNIDSRGMDAPGAGSVDYCANLERLPPSNVLKYQSTDIVQIELAPGWDEGDFSLVPAVCEERTFQKCVRDYPGCTCTYAGDTTSQMPAVDPVLCEGLGGEGAAKCFFREMFQPEDIGQHRVRCFVAKDPHSDRHFVGPNGDGTGLPDVHPPYEDSRCENPGDCAKSANKNTCRSQPMCVKIVVEGHAPEFSGATPTEANSFDENGELIPGQTDVPACEGYPLMLTLEAVDMDTDDEVRIFVEDTDISEASISPRDIRTQLLDLADSWNLDFFASTGQIVDSFWNSYPPQCMGTDGLPAGSPKFRGYGAGKEGDNKNQQNVLPFAKDKTVVGAYSPKIVHVKAPSQQLMYELNARQRNGIMQRANCDQAGQDTTCREKLLNMDQIICGKAYDNSRFRAKRWVGEHDPNGVNIPKALRDHSNGDMASPRHCWRIRLQAPPVFVTSPARESSPFNERWGVQDGIGRSTTGNTTAYKQVYVGINDLVNFTFVAQDPNPEDSVKIFVVDDPGMPPGMSATPTLCIPRGGAQSMCRAEANYSGELPRFDIDSEVESACSKAQLTLSWAPTPEQAGNTFRVCVVARDSSPLCAGKGPPDATSSGWYGEQHCLDATVVEPALHWVEDMLSPSVFTSWVGCETRLELAARDVSAMYDVLIEPTRDLPSGASLSIERHEGGIMTKAIMSWLPARGSEGSTTEVCFSAVDGLRANDPLPERCWQMTVGRCQYCIGTGDTLSLVMKDYGLDTNWLRIWLHNVGTVTNPDLIVSPHPVQNMDDATGNAHGLPRVYVGPIYKVKEGESLQSIAVRFRTSVKSILSLNPDVMGEEDIEADETRLCLIPCQQRRPTPGVEPASYTSA